MSLLLREAFLTFKMTFIPFHDKEYCIAILQIVILHYHKHFNCIKMKNLFLLFAIMLVTACSSEDLVDATDSGNTEQNKVVGNEVSVSQDGYLVFPTSQSLETFVEKLSNGEQPTVLSPSDKSWWN